tara:strand:+ start:136 stop:1386 length:1251 start_codon:yes stop_codon:yes gene_type:complete
MNFYVQSLFIAIPLFIVLIVIEMIISKVKGISVNNSEDMISSLSSGITNTTKDAFKLSIVIVSYAWLVENIQIYQLEPLWLSIFIAFLVQDFMGYWMHRLNHRVNIFWNRHVIHHSSEEFNLSCALRQSISETFKFSAILMIPAALLGIPTKIFVVLAPIHLFMQFWYHTRLIGKMGFLEYIIVTPSHHRVHHAINPEYLDKNYGQILIIWDKLFGSFQPELDHVKPVYGTLRPVSTWNPIIINFKHIYQLIKDAWHANRLFDKLKIWFMPTGWRPKDVEKRFPLNKIDDPFRQIKYKKKNSSMVLAWSWGQHIIAGAMMFHLFSIMNINSPSLLDYLYGIFLFAHIFSFTSRLDHNAYALFVEFCKMMLGFYLLYTQGNIWFNLSEAFSIFIIAYLLVSFFLNANFHFKQNLVSN